MGVPGDDLAVSGTYDVSPSDSSNMFKVTSGDTIYGRWTQITLFKDETSAPTGTNIVKLTIAKE